VNLATLNPADWTKHTLDVLTAIGTVGAVIVALAIAVGGGAFRGIRGWKRRPLPRLTFDPHADIRRETVTVRGKAQMVPSPWVRLGVYNPPDRRAAEDVEVLVAAIRAISPPAGVEDEWIGEGWTSRNYGPLGWTHVSPPSLRIGPGASRTVDLGCLISRHHDGASGGGIERFMLGLPVRPLSMVDQLHPGSYDITLAITGSNFNARYFRIPFEFDGEWTPMEADEGQLKIGDLTLVKPPKA